MSPTAHVPDIAGWLQQRFGLTKSREKDIWLLCIGLAIELEGLAVGVLWVDDGEPGPYEDYEIRMTLGGARDRLERRGLLDPATRNILKAVADLRNSVAHQPVGFPYPRTSHSGRAVGQYRGGDVFVDDDELAKLWREANLAAQAMWAWIAAKHLALQTRQSL